MFWNNFDTLCKSVSKSPNKVAQELSIASGSVTEWKKGRIPSQRTLKKLAEYFGVTIEYFFVKHTDTNQYLSNAPVQEAYNNASDEIKAAVRKLLDMDK